MKIYNLLFKNLSLWWVELYRFSIDNVVYGPESQHKYSKSIQEIHKKQIFQRIDKFYPTCDILPYAYE